MEFEFYVPEPLTGNFSPLALSAVPAGHPQNIAGDDEYLDLNDYVKRGSDSIFYIEVSGQSMVDYGINDGDLLVVDRRKEPRNGDVVMAEIDGSFTVKRFVRWERQLFLVPENRDFRTRQIQEHEHFAVWGVVTHVVHRIS